MVGRGGEGDSLFSAAAAARTCELPGAARGRWCASADIGGGPGRGSVPQEAATQHPWPLAPHPSRPRARPSPSVCRPLRAPGRAQSPGHRALSVALRLPAGWRGLCSWPLLPRSPGTAPPRGVLFPAGSQEMQVGTVPDPGPTFNTCSVWSLIRSLSCTYALKSMFGSSPAVLRNPKVTSMTDRASQASL